jgi:endoglucanase
MNDERFAFLKELVEAPSPSGYEQPARMIWRREVEAAADELRTDLHGNTIAALNPGGSPRVMLAGHVDEIGFIVNYIDDEGFVYFGGIGGHDPFVVPGQRVCIHTATGPFLGAIGRRPVHFLRGEEREKGVELHDLWIDLGVRSREEAAQRVRVGDPITFAAGLERLEDDRVVSRGLDNKMGAFIVAETLKAVATRQPKAALFAVATVQEEIGLRGAYTSTFSVDPQVGIAIDVTHALDHPGASGEKKRYGDVGLGRGPVIMRSPSVNPVVFDRLIAAAMAAEIPYQIEPAGGSSGTDADAVQRSRGGVATGVVSVALRYMHTPVEVLELGDIDHTIDLLAEFIVRLDRETDFTP